MTRRFRPYPSYKDSGVEWLGRIPKGWETKPLKRAASSPVVKGIGRELPFIDLEHVLSGEGMPTPGYDWPDASADGCAMFQKGDVLFGKLRPYLAKVLAADRDGCCPTELLVLHPDRVNTHGRHLYYLCLSRAFLSLAAATSYGVKMPRTSWEKLGPSYVAMPSPSEQHAIAAFLDRETQRIDALVEKKERLVELLQEKRTALISHAVTKGLDPNVRMKDSGVEWLEEIPEHWEVRTLKHFAARVTSGSRGWAGYYSDQGSLFLRIGNLSSDAIDLDLADVQRVEPPSGAEGERTLVRAGDILVSITALIGAVGVVPSGLTDAYVNQHLSLVRTECTLADNRWLAYCILSRVGQVQFATALYGGTKQGLTLSDVRSLVVLWPPEAERADAVGFLDRETKRIDALVEKVKRSVELLKEYRTALISAAVTGKIDVRNVA